MFLREKIILIFKSIILGKNNFPMNLIQNIASPLAYCLSASSPAGAPIREARVSAAAH